MFAAGGGGGRRDTVSYGSNEINTDRARVETACAILEIITSRRPRSRVLYIIVRLRARPKAKSQLEPYFRFFLESPVVYVGHVFEPD